ncbi:MAG: hypothetical protein IT225_07490 [Flavobacteriales bacterium]|nr:hypothetical protein [Flavobacteriales bacterium]
MNTEEKYLNALNDMIRRRSFSMHDVCKSHRISYTVGTIVKQLGWVTQCTKGRAWKWAGPSPIEPQDFTAFIQLVREYKRETRKNAPSMMPGARQERRERTDKFQGRRTDKMNQTTHSILWGLYKWTTTK